MGMKIGKIVCGWLLSGIAVGFWSSLFAGPAVTLFETVTAYHYIRVVDQDNVRTLYFDNAPQSRMLVQSPALGHFGYVDLFHLARLWKDSMTNVLMIGLGGGSAQRSFEAFDPNLQIETVEIDPVVVRVATNYFSFKTGSNQIVHINDGRMFLRRTTKVYDLIVVDAYTASRYGAAIPVHLATCEFFVLAANRLTTNGVLAYNVIGTIDGWQRNLVASIYKTMKSVFPQVYLVPATDSLNVVLVGVNGTNMITSSELTRRASELVNAVRIPSSLLRSVPQIRFVPPPWFDQGIILTDNYAPVEGLTRMGRIQ
jgi:spermidine synthase